MKLEELNNNTLYKLLKTIYNSMDGELGDIYDDYLSDSTSKIRDVLKYIGADNDFLNIQYIYVCLRKNWDKLPSETPFELIRPTLKNYDITLDVNVTKSCVESYTHRISSYDNNLNDYLNMMHSDGDFFPTDGKFIDEDCNYYDTDGWKIGNIEEV